MRFPTRVTAKNPIWANTAKAYDFVGFDPRGVGHSAPISCIDPQEFVKAPKADPVPDSEADKLAQRKLAREYADGCAERSGKAMLAQMTTPNTVRDLDVIRAALGEKKLNYLGVSYGTYIGAVYGTMFPGHVRRMIVDSVVNPRGRRSGTRPTWTRTSPSRAAGMTGRTGSPPTTPPSTSAPRAPRYRRSGSNCAPPPRRTPSAGSSARPS